MKLFIPKCHLNCDCSSSLIFFFCSFFFLLLLLLLIVVVIDSYALNLCKKALATNENDLGKAELWLKEEARRNGWQKATQMQVRTVRIVRTVNVRYVQPTRLYCLG